MATSERTALYRLFDAQNELLYIGITWQPMPTRMSGHAGQQSWWQEVHHATATWYETREDADQAETAAIQAEQPKYNKAKTGSPRTRRPRSNKQLSAQPTVPTTRLRCPGTEEPCRRPGPFSCGGTNGIGWPCLLAASVTGDEARRLISAAVAALRDA